MKNKILSIVMLFALVCTLGGEVILSAFAVKASAAEDIPKNIKTTSIEEDNLELSVTKYGKDSSGQCSVYSFMEYCYSEHEDIMKNFSLFVYVYNPTEKEIVLEKEFNTITINGDQFFLNCLDKTSNNRFYKFEVSNAVVGEIVDGARKYDVSELQIYHGYSSEYLDKCAIDSIYEFRGYGGWCDSEKNPESTLECIKTGSESISFEVHDTYYRTGSTNNLDYSTINSVYFSLPIDYIQKYGSVTQIKAKWYEYLTSPMYITNDKSVYADMIDNAGDKLTLLNDFCVFWGISERKVDGFDSDYYVSSGLNIGLEDDGSNLKFTNSLMNAYSITVKDESKIFSYYDSFQWLFLKEDAETKEDYRVKSEELIKYAQKYTLNHSDNLIRNRYSTELFMPYIEQNRIELLSNPSEKCGLVEIVFDIEKEEKFSKVEQSIWDKIWNKHSVEGVWYSPIVEVQEGDLYLDPRVFSEKYLVNIDDVNEIIDFGKTAYSNSEVPFLLRHAVTNYSASEAHFATNLLGDSDGYDESSGELPSYFQLGRKNGYVAQETVFLDFDVISLEFTSDDGINKKIIGVVSAPIDIFNDLTAPDGMVNDVQDEEWWQILVALLGLILLVVIVIFLWPFISFFLGILWTGIKVVVSIITLPFRVLLNIMFKRKR